MPKYVANAYLQHNGQIVQEGGVVELTEEQAELLGDKVSLTEEGQLEELTVPELKTKAKQKGIAGVSDLNKDALIDVLVEKK